MSKEIYNIPEKLTRVVRSLYTKCTCKVKNNHMSTEVFEVKTGVRQRSVLSPFLFIIYMDNCLRDICSGEEETFVYADDAAIITDTSDALQMALNRQREGTPNKGLKINAQKTEVMHVGTDSIELQVNIGDVRLKQVDTFSYLGVSTNEENKQDIEIDRRMTKYNTNVSALFPLLKDKHVPTPAKVLIFTTILRPILLYGSENWSLTIKTASRVQAAEMETLRMIRGVIRMDLMRNERIREDLGVESLTEVEEEEVYLNREAWREIVHRSLE